MPDKDIIKQYLGHMAFVIYIYAMPMWRLFLLPKGGLDMYDHSIK